jgi:flagellar basal body L-ring protein FlgH
MPGPPIDLGNGIFTDDEEDVLNWKGNNFYKACGAVVATLPDGSTSTCVKHLGHPSNEHEDINGQTKPVLEFDFSELSLEDAVAAAIVAVGTCWSTTQDAVFDSSKAKTIGDLLVARIREFGPIYG